jgi:hypothetical protein
VRSVPWRFVALVVAVAGIAALVTIVVFVWPWTGDRGQIHALRQTECMSNLSELVKAYDDARDDGRLDPTLHGSAQILSWFGDGGVPFGREEVLFCPVDGEAAQPETDDERRAFRPADAASLRGARGLGSYAVRDFERCPVDAANTEKQPILCDRQGADGRTPHHKNTILIAFANGDVQKWSREQLGVAPGEPIVVGPDSPIPMLRVFERP